MRTNAGFCCPKGLAIGLLIISFDLLGAMNSAFVGATDYRDLFPDTWVAHDALGRNLPPFSVVGPVKKDHRRAVGIFYITCISGDSAPNRRFNYRCIWKKSGARKGR
jgi:hypothetical protein